MPGRSCGTRSRACADDPERPCRQAARPGPPPPARQLGPAEHRLWCYGEAGVPGIGLVCAAQQLEADFARASAHFATAAASSAGMKLRPVLS